MAGPNKSPLDNSPPRLLKLSENWLLAACSTKTAHLLNSNGLAIWHGFPVSTHIEIKSCCRSAILNLIKLNFFMVYLYLKLHILFNSNGLAIWYGFPVITHIEVKSSCRSAILNLIKFKFFMVYPYLKLHILYNSNGVAIWAGFLDIMNITKLIADSGRFWPPWPSFCPNLAQFRARPS